MSCSSDGVSENSAALKLDDCSGNAGIIRMNQDSDNHLPRVELEVLPIFWKNFRSELRLNFKILEAANAPAYLSGRPREKSSNMTLTLNCCTVSSQSPSSLQIQNLAKMPRQEAEKILQDFRIPHEMFDRTLERISRLTIHHDPNNIKDFNLFNDTKYPGLDDLIENLRYTIRSDEPLQLLVSEAVTVSCISKLEESFREQRTNNPLIDWARWESSGKVFSLCQAFQPPHEAICPGLHSPRRVFDGLHEYTHLIGFSARQEQEYGEDDFPAMKSTAVFCEFNNGNDRTYSAHLSFEKHEDKPLPRVGDMVRIFVESDELISRTKLSYEDPYDDPYDVSEESRREWPTAHVSTLRKENGKMSIYVFIERPKDMPRRSWSLPNSVGIPEDKIVRFDEPESQYAPTKIVENAPKVKTIFRVLNSTLPFERTNKALLSLNEYKLREEMALSLKILLGTELDQLPMRNIFDTLSHDPGVLRKSMATLTMDQLKVLCWATKSRAGINVIEGPAGSGKTHTALLIAQLKLSCEIPGKKKQQLLSVFPVNQAASCAAVKFKEQLTDLWRPMSDMPTPLVIRLHTRETERQIFFQRFFKAMLNDKEDLKIVKKRMQNLGLQPEQVEERIFRKTGVEDHRLTQPECSLGWAAAQELIKDAKCENPKHRDLFRHLKFCLNQRCLKPELQARLKMDVDQFFGKVLSEAHAVLTTICNAHDPMLWENFSPDTLVIDEAAKTKESEILGMFVYYGKSVQDYFFVGDRVQGSPYSKSARASNVLSAQDSYSPFNRMIDLGHAYTLLTAQRRSVSGITKLVGAHYYSKELTNPPEIDERASALRARKFIMKNFGIDAPVVLVALSETETASYDKSKYNESTNEAAMEIISMATKFGYEGKDLAILSPYSDSIKHFRTKLVNYKKLSEGDKRSLVLQSFDQIQGTERSVVVLEYPNTETLGFIEDNARNYSGLTRAADAAILVMNVGALRRNRRFRHTSLGRLVSTLQSQGHVYSWPKPKTASA